MIRRDWIIFGNRWHVRDRNRVHSFLYIMPSAWVSEGYDTTEYEHGNDTEWFLWYRPIRSEDWRCRHSNLDAYCIYHFPDTTHWRTPFLSSFLSFHPFIHHLLASHTTAACVLLPSLDTAQPTKCLRYNSTLSTGPPLPSHNTHISIAPRAMPVYTF